MEMLHAQEDRLLYRNLFLAIVTGTGQKSKIPTDFFELIVENVIPRHSIIGKNAKNFSEKRL
jgi:hypothetical protein